jgi:hypothetical protein
MNAARRRRRPSAAGRLNQICAHIRGWGIATTLVAIVLVTQAYLFWPKLFDQSVLYADLTGARWLRAIVAFGLSFFPGWLLVRFVRLRGPALWSEYVVTLHRLGVDARPYLPAPPLSSEYHERWAHARGRRGIELDCDDNNLYLRKFEASYGPVEEPGGVGVPRGKLTADTAFPVLLLTTTFAAGWVAILSDPELYGAPPVLLARVLAVSFAGAYLFILQMLIRRYFQNDIKSSAYVAAFARLVTVMTTATVLYQVVREGPKPWQEPAIIATSFVIGFFPVAGIVFLRNIAARWLGRVVGSLESHYPLNQLDGLNLWYETRLIEEGIEDMCELVNANLVDVLLHTRVPAGRLIDWIDQAHLYLHLPPLDDRPAPRSGRGRQPAGPPLHARTVLRRAGIVNATSLLVAFGEYNPAEDTTPAVPTVHPWPPADRAEDLRAWIDDQLATTPAAQVHIPTIVRVLRNHTGLTPIMNWRQWGATRLRELESGYGDRDFADGPDELNATG